MPLTIADPNDDRGLLTTAELRAAAGLSSTDSSQDATLVPLGAYISAVITKTCGVQAAAAIEPTLRLETVSETFFFKSLQKCLVLARRPVTEIISVTEVNTVLTTDDYQHDGAAGILYRKNGVGPYFEVVGPWGWPGPYGWWPCGNTVVEYSAGFDDVPADLKYAAIKFVQAERAQGSRDPLLKRIRIDGISEREYWIPGIDPSKTTVVPGEVMDILNRGGYVNGLTFA